MKGAAIARYAAKAPSLKKTRAARQLAARAGISTDPKKLDPRGKAYDWNVYLRASNLAEIIKDAVVKGNIGGHRDGAQRDLREHSLDLRLPQVQKKPLLGQPEVIRDVRKKEAGAGPPAEPRERHLHVCGAEGRARTLAGDPQHARLRQGI